MPDPVTETALAPRAVIEGVVNHREDHFAWTLIDDEHLTDWLYTSGFDDGMRVRITVEGIPKPIGIEHAPAFHETCCGNCDSGFCYVDQMTGA